MRRRWQRSAPLEPSPLVESPAPALDRVVDDLVAASLARTPVDWSAAGSSAGAGRPLLRQLSVLAAVVERRRGASVETMTLSLLPPASPESHPDAMPELWGHLRVLDRIGGGSFGDVYRAWDTRLDREVALKLLAAGRSAGGSAASTIVHEGRLLARVRHPNVVTIYGAEQIADRIGLWMELVRGRTLEQVLDVATMLDVTETIAIGVELCRAVSAVHHAGLIHRDIKAHNVMRAEDGRIVLMDFGAGRERDEEGSSDLAGTPLYLAPEVLAGQQAGVQSDVYSLGVLLYHLLTGSYPVHAVTVAEVRRAHERGERTPLRRRRRHVPHRLARVIERAIEPDRGRRYQSVEALGADLQALQPGRGGARRVRAAAIAACVLLLAGLGWEWAGRRTGAATTPGAWLAGVVSSGSTAVTTNPVERPIIAVLPLQNLSAEPDSDFFVDGLTDEIIRNLALIDGLDVRSRTSSFAFKGKPRNLPDVGAQLGANLIVEGSVLRSGRRLRVNAQLVRVAGEVPLWAERFDREIDDVFAIQDEISQAVVNNLRLTLGRGRRRYETNIQSYELYLKARVLADRRGFFDARQAAELFEQVIARDPAFAPAHAGLADAYASMSLDIHGAHIPALPSEQALPVMRRAATRAVELDPLLPEAHAAMAFVSARELDWDHALASFGRAIELGPGLTAVAAEYVLSTLLPLGRVAEAEQLLRDVMRRDPLSLTAQRALGLVQRQAGRYDEAIDTLARIRTIDPNFPYVDIQLARVLTFAGRPAEALRVLSARSDQPGVQVWMALALVQAGQRAAAERLAAEHEHPFRLAVIHAALGQYDQALDALERAADIVPHRVVALLREPEMAALHDHPRVVALRRRFAVP